MNLVEGMRVRVISAEDTEIYSVAQYLDLVGTVERLPEHQWEMIKVRFDDGRLEDFWASELRREP